MEYSWSEKFSVGIQALDRQHQVIFRLIGELSNVLASTTPNQYRAKALLNEIVTYAIVHFEDEEGFLSDVGYDEIEAHRKNHSAYAEYVGTQMALSITDDHNYGDLLSFLRNWWQQHILLEDMQYKSLAAAL